MDDRVSNAARSAAISRRPSESFSDPARRAGPESGPLRTGPRAAPVAPRLPGPLPLYPVPGGDVGGADQAGPGFKGTNVRYVGESKGRGRPAPPPACTRSQKKVFIYERDPGWRRQLGGDVARRPTRAVGAGLDPDQWAEPEFGQAELGDQRRTARLVQRVHLVAASRGRPVTASPQGDRAVVRGYGRFVEQAPEVGVTPEKVLAPHRQRRRTPAPVRGGQEGTDIRYSPCPECDNLEGIGRNQTKAKALGVHWQATRVMNEEGLPLGGWRGSYRTKAGKTKTLRG